MSTDWAVRPSQILGLSDDVAAFYLDRAVHHFGSSLEAALQEVQNDAKNTKEAQTKTARVFAKWMQQKQQFKNPLA